MAEVEDAYTELSKDGIHFVPPLFIFPPLFISFDQDSVPDDATLG
jgi:hypothetical protein